MKRDIWTKTKLCGNFQLPSKITVRPYRNMNEVSVSLSIEAKGWSGYLYLSAHEAKQVSKQLLKSAALAEKDFQR